MRRMSKPVIVTPLAKLLDVLVFQFGGTRASFAAEARITRAQLSQYMNPKPGAQMPGVLVCLKIAVAGRCAPARVLRAANQFAAADLLDKLVGVVKEEPSATFQRQQQITPAELALVRKFRALAARDQRAFALLIERAHAAQLATRDAEAAQARKEGA